MHRRTLALLALLVAIAFPAVAHNRTPLTDLSPAITWDEPSSAITADELPIVDEATVAAFDEAARIAIDLPANPLAGLDAHLAAIISPAETELLPIVSGLENRCSGFPVSLTEANLKETGELSLKLHWGRDHVRNRWFDPNTGTWLTPDPLGYRDSSNLYAFCGGDPVNERDPLGLGESLTPDERRKIQANRAAEREAERLRYEASIAAGGSLYAAAPGDPENPFAIAAYFGDSILVNAFSDPRSNYHPLNENEPTQISRDVRAFRQKYWAPVFGVEAGLALTSPGKTLKVAGVVLAAFGAFENSEAAAGKYQILENEQALNAEGRHVVTELHRMTGEAETILDRGHGTTSEALLFQKHKDKWFSFFFRGRAIQAETEQLLAVATKTDSVLAGVKVRAKVGGLVPDFVFNQGGRQLIVDITSPRKSSILKALKYIRTGEEIIAEIYHMGRGLK